MKSLLNEIKKGKVLVSDGAWGTFLMKRGLKAGECPEYWNISHKEDVFAIAKSYVDAGSDIILTNSFGGSPYKLKHFDLSENAFEINKQAALISREAAGENIYVLGSIGPTGAMLIMNEITESELYDGFFLQAKALMSGGVDAICIETMTDINEAKIAVKAAKDATNLEVACTFTFDKVANNEFKTIMGVSPKEVIDAILEVNADVIGTNCGIGFELMIDIVKELRKYNSTIPILVHANAGLPIFNNNIIEYPDTPEIMGNFVPKLVEAGANIIGGCCGTTPDHIKAIVRVIKN